jgi:hypothetical protein
MRVHQLMLSAMCYLPLLSSIICGAVMRTASLAHAVLLTFLAGLLHSALDVRFACVAAVQSCRIA